MKESISAVKEKILDFIKRDIVIKVFAGGLAIILWLLINNQLNPVVTDITAMPKIVVNYTIKPGDIIVESASGILLKNKTSGNFQEADKPNVIPVSFYASGRKNQIETLTYNDFTVDLDLSEVKKSGESREYDVKIVVKSNVWGVEPKNQEVDLVKLTFEEVTDKVNIPIEVSYNDSEITAEGYTIVSANLSKETLDITGFRSDIKNIARARIDLTKDDFQQKLTSDITINKTYSFYDADNKKIEIEGYNPDFVKVSLKIGKKVELKYTVKGSPLTGVYLKEKDTTITPAEVIVVGTPSILDGLVSLNTSEVSIEGRNSDFSEPVTIDLPPGISLVEDVKPTVSVKFGGVISKEITIGINNVTITGWDKEKYDFMIESVASLIVQGNDDVIKNLSVSSLNPKINVSGYSSAGVVSIPVTVTLPSDVSVTKSAIATVKVTVKVIDTPTNTITDTASDSPTPTGSPSPENSEPPTP